MMKPDTAEDLMRRYLLGDLPQSEIDELEVEVLRDDEKFEQIWDIENQLVDGYVRGRLAAAERERFERHYQSSSVHRQRVAVARNLVEEADGSRAAVIPEPMKTSWRPRLSERLSFSVLSWQSALAAAALLLATCSVWLFLDRSHLRQSQEQLKAESQASQNREQGLNQQLATAQEQSKKLESEIERLRGRQNTNAEPATQAEQTPRPTVYSLLLSPMLMRSGDSPQTATIPSPTDVVRLRMKVDQENLRRFKVSVRTVEGRQIWKQQINLNARNSIITAQLPARKLPAGDYILTLSASNPAGQPEEVNRYFFRVIGR